MAGHKRVKPRRPTGRNVAAKALWRVEVKDAFAGLALEGLFQKHGLDQKERALATELTYGVLRWLLLIDFFLGQVADRPLHKVERRARIALRMGAYQLLMLDRIPARAAVNESVSLAPAQARGFVNAVLRSLADKKDRLEKPDGIEDPVERLCIELSHPGWMVEEWAGQIGLEATRELLRANNRRPGLTLRVNTLRTGRDVLIRTLANEGLDARPGEISPLSVILPEPMPAPRVPGFEQGLFAVQDQASQLAPMVLDPRPGETILDACAAPGTKSFEIMQLMEGRGRVIAADVHKERLKRMSAEAQRLGIKNVTRVEADASVAVEEWAALPERFRGIKFDRVLVDAPCTGLGAIRRKPEIKWRRRPGEAKERARLQRAILTEMSKALKPGGVLVYSTCTLTREENEGAVAPLLHSGEFSLEQPAPGERFRTGTRLKGLAEHKVLRTWPHLAGTDGFTIFKLRKDKG